MFDAIQGRSPRTAGDGYGDVSLKAKFDAIEAAAVWDRMIDRATEKLADGRRT